MKKKRKIIASTIALSTMFSPISVFADTNNVSVIAESPADVLQQVRLLGLMQGDLNGDMRPNAALTRAQLAMILCNLFHLDITPVQSSDFLDVSPSGWSAGAIHAIRQAGIMDGYGKNFGPNDKITREQLAVVLVRALGIDAQGKGENLPPDLKALTSAWAQNAVQTIRELGYMELNGSPQQEMKRQDIAAVIINVVDQPAGEIQIGSGTIKIGGIAYDVPDRLQGVLNADNAGALKGSKLEFTRDGFKITGLKRLELNVADSVLDANNTELTADVVANAKVALKNMKATGKLTVNGSALDMDNVTFTLVELTGSDVAFRAKGKSSAVVLVTGAKASIGTDADAIVKRLQVGESTSYLEIKGHVQQLEINEPTQVKIILGQGAKVDNVLVSATAKLKNFFVDYDKIKSSLPVVNNGPNPDLNAPVQSYSSNPQHSSNPQPGVDKTALISKIAEADALKVQHTVGNNAGQVTQAAWDAFAAAIQAASNVSSSGQATQQQVNSALSALTQAIADFQTAYNPQASVDKTALNSKIAEADALSVQHTVGNNAGQVTQAAWDAFTAAIQAASNVSSSGQATQQQVNSALNALTQAIADFQTAYSQELTISLAPGAQFPFNNANSTDVTISDSYWETVPGTKYQYSKRNIKDLIKVKRGTKEEAFKYDSGTQSFYVYDLTDHGTPDLNNQRGQVKLTATTTDINLSGNGMYGVFVRASDSAYAATSAAIDFELFEGNNSKGKVSLPILLDRISPAWTGGSWTSASGSDLAKITVNSNEPIFIAGVIGSIASVQVDYSQSGDFTDTVQVPLNPTNGYTKFEAVENDLFIYMAQPWIDMMNQTKPPTAVSKFRITMNGIYDYANNEAANRVVLVDVPVF
ncbi:S-layer homology domain-containing protein [Paenibacillus dokdonensis]|uniref:S-layer homology domain-containing protein n=1 Tax=Paenibacillus dokdonensis TaxID=2567944 RepID=UPI0010A8E049|nr:S-layer homology domain-containing protein [Paenibacillus dokdonensis]